MERHHARESSSGTDAHRAPADRGSAALPDLTTRAAGILLHPTSLPGPAGIGDLGPAAYDFAQFLEEAAQSWWQMLPVGPVGRANSPYQSESTFAGSHLLIALEGLVEDGLLEPRDLAPPAPFPAERVTYDAAERFKEIRLAKAFLAFEARREADEELARLAAAGPWLADFALYRAIKDAHAGAPWTDWPAPLRDRDPGALAEARSRLAREIRYHAFQQLVFERQWQRLRAHCAARGIGWIGDLPIFVSHDSAEVWAHPELFELGADGRPALIAGVPPDYFSSTGQLWGNPLYRWERMAADGYAWWIERFRAVLARFDAVRVDHFIGFVHYWEIPAGARTARRGHWRQGPGTGFFRRLREALGEVPIIAEDLGSVTPEVTALRERYGFPGMRVLQFGFDGGEAVEHLPENHPAATVAYTGTHDNDTALGWLADPPVAPGVHAPRERERLRERALAYLNSDGSEAHWDMIRAVLESPARTAIVPLQDVLGLGSEARMNRPGTVHGNWEWRFRPGALTPAVAARLRETTLAAGRGAARRGAAA